jgi:hypothetical protein
MSSRTGRRRQLADVRGTLMYTCAHPEDQNK